MLARPATARPGGGFRKGRTTLHLGFSASSEHTAILAAYGYYLHRHLEAGLAGTAEFWKDYPDRGQLGPYLRAYLLPGPPVAPFLHLAAGRLWVQGENDGWMLHWGVGAAIFIGRHLMLLGELFQEQYRLPERETKTVTDYRIGAGFLF